MLKMVFVAFTQHCIQSTVTYFTHVEGVKDTMYSVYSGLSPLPGGKAISYSTDLKSLLSWGFSGSPPVSLRRQLC